MEEMNLREQIVLTYYIHYYVDNDPNTMAELHHALSEELGETYTETLEELKEEGLVNGLEALPDSYVEQGAEKITKPMLTNKGVMLIENILDIHSYAVERDKLSYIQNNLERNSIRLTVQTLKNYLEKAKKGSAEE
ncbi:hypothetical protein [Bacillus thermotolerans]|uniref:Uncharacterized protein n=1 Tax=Bacillus thermotolerans TaxID=1221996 RepID=A0A0F5HUF1_BACTR|nr:hypothetical protein [Bacillus thermotolerans]KKB36655.1 hypothetical protein QY97_00827 [Bacillus thermotolerans]KKB39896.1 hypothetical protein QY96_02683 [Bacillus thermotolerans]KKB40854.1 hypothetical protein QY95_01166 [Bacillus thermotolerans]